MAHIPAANTLATTIKAIIGTPPGGPLVFLIGVAFPIIVLFGSYFESDECRSNSLKTPRSS
jgi:hypothetical protein